MMKMPVKRGSCGPARNFGEPLSLRPALLPKIPKQHWPLSGPRWTALGVCAAVHRKRCRRNGRLYLPNAATPPMLSFWPCANGDRDAGSIGTKIGEPSGAKHFCPPPLRLLKPGKSIADYLKP